LTDRFEGIIVSHVDWKINIRE